MSADARFYAAETVRDQGQEVGDKHETQCQRQLTVLVVAYPRTSLKPCKRSLMVSSHLACVEISESKLESDLEMNIPKPAHRGLSRRTNLRFSVDRAFIFLNLRVNHLIIESFFVLWARNEMKISFSQPLPRVFPDFDRQMPLVLTYSLNVSLE